MIIPYLKYHILKHIPVKQAVTAEEKSKIYQFRYQVYHDEYKMLEENYDHEQKLLKDKLDDADNSIISYTTTKNHISSTCRAHFLSRDSVSEEV